MTLATYQVGHAWPHPLAGEGLQAVADPRDDGLDIMLVAAIQRPTDAEVRALTRGPLRLGLLLAGPLIGIIAAADRIELDAPYAPGLGGEEQLFTASAAAALARSWPTGATRLLTLATVDYADGVVRGLRTVTLSRQWWIVMADAIAAAWPVTPSQRDMARDALYTRYPRVLDMLSTCAIVERVGLAV